MSNYRQLTCSLATRWKATRPVWVEVASEVFHIIGNKKHVPGEKQPTWKDLDSPKMSTVYITRVDKLNCATPPHRGKCGVQH